jgi:hypothetical protein
MSISLATKGILGDCVYSSGDIVIKYINVPVCDPDMVTNDFGNKTMRVTAIEDGSSTPSMGISDVGNKTMRTSGELDGVPIVPNMDVQDVGNKTMRPVTRKACYSYPRPINI